MLLHNSILALRAGDPRDRALEKNNTKQRNTRKYKSMITYTKITTNKKETVVLEGTIRETAI